jgi:hypothetical protein
MRHQLSSQFTIQPTVWRQGLDCTLASFDSLPLVPGIAQFGGSLPDQLDSVQDGLRQCGINLLQ